MHCGTVAVLGRPNVGKSTLVNRISGQKVAIVSNRPQTTRHRIRGVWHGEDAQLVFVDTPGLHKPHHRLGEELVLAAERALEDVDVVLVLVDGTTAPGPGDRHVVDRAMASGRPVYLGINKIDRKAKGQDYGQAYVSLGNFASVHVLSAQKGTGVAALLRSLGSSMPEGPALFPEEMVTDQTLRQLAGELVREQLMRQLSDELPHATAVSVDRFDESDPGLTRIEATIHVERESQKGIVIGVGAERLKSVGTLARAAIEQQTGTRVHLELRVKVLPHWRRDAAKLKRLGYIVD
ncbi:MAG: GTPase Era [Candidatus Sericytochromatia bacterium]|nr:GTPase Era [Candidatus Sericytochromatia bacterium]